MNDLSIDDILQQWQTERPDLDLQPMRVIGQLSRTAARSGQRQLQVFRQFGLSASEFDILATLRRSGAPYALNPSQIVAALMINNSTLTSRLDRLEKQGWIRRVPIADDRRSVHIQLSAEGRAVIDVAVEKHLHNERAMVAGLSGQEQQTLVVLLAKLEQQILTTE